MLYIRVTHALAPRIVVCERAGFTAQPHSRDDVRDSDFSGNPQSRVHMDPARLLGGAARLRRELQQQRVGDLPGR